MKAELDPLDGGPTIELAKNVSVAGRSNECDVHLDRRSVSKMHCILVKTEGFLFVRDLISTNGTKVNGRRILRAALLPGDMLNIGGQKFRVCLGPDDPVSRRDACNESSSRSAAPITREAAQRGTDSALCSTSSSVLPLPDNEEWPVPPLADESRNS